MKNIRLKRYKLTTKEVLSVYAIGASGYYLLEILWRGRSHWSMAVLGGFCFLLFYSLNTFFHFKRLWHSCFCGAVLITALEFACGCLVNLTLSWNVWDYSRSRFHVLGQICLEYSCLWFLLCIPLCGLSAAIRKKISRGEGQA